MLYYHITTCYIYCMKKILLETFFYEMGLRGCKNQSVLALNAATNQTELIEPFEIPSGVVSVEYSTRSDTDFAKITFLLDKVSGLFRISKDCEQHGNPNDRFSIDVLIYMLKQSFFKVHLVLESQGISQSLVGTIRLSDKSGSIHVIDLDRDYLVDSIDMLQITYSASMTGCNIHQETTLSELDASLLKEKTYDQIQSHLLFKLRDKVVQVTDKIKDMPQMVFLA